MTLKCKHEELGLRTCSICSYTSQQWNFSENIFEKKNGLTWQDLAIKKNELMAYENIPFTKIVEDQIIKDMQEITDRDIQEKLNTISKEIKIKLGNTLGCSVSSGDMITIDSLNPETYKVMSVDDIVTNINTNNDDKFVKKVNDHTIKINKDVNCPTIYFGNAIDDMVKEWKKGDFINLVTNYQHKVDPKPEKFDSKIFEINDKKDGSMWKFSEPEFIGRNYVLEPSIKIPVTTKEIVGRDKIDFGFNQQAEFIKKQCKPDKIYPPIKEVIGYGIGNISSLEKLELYAADFKIVDNLQIVETVKVNDFMPVLYYIIGLYRDTKIRVDLMLEDYSLYYFDRYSFKVEEGLGIYTKYKWTVYSLTWGDLFLQVNIYEL